MILFIFEGKKTEPNLFKTIEKLFFQNTEEQKICCFGYNIYELYKLMNESDFTENVISVIRTKMVTRNDCHDFKDYVTETYNHYKSTDYFIFSIDNKTKTLRPFTPEKETLVTENWKHLNKQNICKANFICKEINELPASKDDVNQTSVFENQLTKYVEKDETVSILNSFPLFLYEYFKEIF